MPRKQGKRSYRLALTAREVHMLCGLLRAIPTKYKTASTRAVTRRACRLSARTMAVVVKPRERAVMRRLERLR